jgi:predicted TIM-barrel fold metal-dependent hydrolase
MTVSEAKSDFSVIDADGHVIEPPGIWREYTEQKFWSRLPRPVRDDNGLFCYAIGDRLVMRTASRMTMDPADACAPSVLAQVGGDCIVWASDYPHTDHDFSGAVRATREILERSGPDAARRVLDANPRRFYRL